jgi:hypothetical protein
VLGELRAHAAVHGPVARVVVPELANSGYVFRDAEEVRALSQPADGPSVSAWAELAREHDLVVVGGFCEENPEGRLHHSAVLIDGARGVRAVYRKAHRWDREGLVFVAGDAPGRRVGARGPEFRTRRAGLRRPVVRQPVTSAPQARDDLSLAADRMRRHGPAMSQLVRQVVPRRMSGHARTRAGSRRPRRPASA